MTPLTPLLAPTPANGMQLLERVTRAENFGSQYVHWLEVIVDAKDPGFDLLANLEHFVA